MIIAWTKDIVAMSFVPSAVLEKLNNAYAQGHHRDQPHHSSSAEAHYQCHYQQPLAAGGKARVHSRAQRAVLPDMNDRRHSQHQLSAVLTPPSSVSSPGMMWGNTPTPKKFRSTESSSSNSRPLHIRVEAYACRKVKPQMITFAQQQQLMRQKEQEARQQQALGLAASLQSPSMGGSFLLATEEESGGGADNGSRNTLDVNGEEDRLIAIGATMRRFKRERLERDADEAHDNNPQSSSNTDGMTVASYPTSTVIHERLPQLAAVMNSLYGSDGYDYSLAEGILDPDCFKYFSQQEEFEDELSELLSHSKGGERDVLTAVGMESMGSGGSSLNEECDVRRMISAGIDSTSSSSSLPKPLLASASQRQRHQEFWSGIYETLQSTGKENNATPQPSPKLQPQPPPPQNFPQQLNNNSTSSSNNGLAHLEFYQLTAPHLDPILTSAHEEQFVSDTAVVTHCAGQPEKKHKQQNGSRGLGPKSPVSHGAMHMFPSDVAELSPDSLAVGSGQTNAAAPVFTPPSGKAGMFPSYSSSSDGTNAFAGLHIRSNPRSTICSSQPQRGAQNSTASAETNPHDEVMIDDEAVFSPPIIRDADDASSEYYYSASSSPTAAHGACERSNVGGAGFLGTGADGLVSAPTLSQHYFIYNRKTKMMVVVVIHN